MSIISCTGGAADSGTSSETGRIVMSGSRALGTPQRSDLQNFILKGSCDGGSEETIKEWSSASSITGSVIELGVGEWSFTLEAEYPSGKTYTYSGSQSAVVRGGETSTVSFMLRAQGFQPSEADVSNVILSNGYVCENSVSELSRISGASPIGVVISSDSETFLAMMKISGEEYCIGGTGSTYGQLTETIEALGYRIPTQAELPLVLSKFSELGITRPTTGHLASSTGSATSHQCFSLISADSEASNTGAYMGVSDSFAGTSLYSVAVKSFSR